VITARVFAACLASVGLTIPVTIWDTRSGGRATIEGTVEPQGFAVISPTGGEVQEVLVHPGDRVGAGQVLIHLKTWNHDPQMERSRAALKRLPPAFLETAAGVLERVRPHTWAELMGTDPELRTAEQEYVDATAALLANDSGAARKRVDAAIERRRQAHQRLGTFGPDTLRTAQILLRNSSGTVRLLDKMAASYEVRSAEPATIELLDLHPGDMVLPLGHVALLAATNRWVVRARVPESAARDWHSGREIQVRLATGEQVNATIQNITGRDLTALATNLPVRPAPGSAVSIAQ
jgi:multidrug resistance efflux pump